LEISEELNQTEKNKKDSENLSYGLVSSSIPVYKIDLDVKAPDTMYLQNIMVMKSGDQLKYSFISTQNVFSNGFCIRKIFFFSIVFEIQV
jgi:hypothetical protein